MNAPEAQPRKNDFAAPDEDQTHNRLMTAEILLPLSYLDSDGELRRKSD